MDNMETMTFKHVFLFGLVVVATDCYHRLFVCCLLCNRLFVCSLGV